MSNSFIGSLLAAFCATVAASGQVVIQAPQVPEKPTVPAEALRETIVAGALSIHSNVTVVGNVDAVRTAALAALPDCTRVHEAQVAVAIAAATSIGDHQPQKIETVQKAVSGWVKIHTDASTSYVDHWVKVVTEDPRLLSTMVEDQKVLARLNEPGIADRIVWWWKR